MKKAGFTLKSFGNMHPLGENDKVRKGDRFSVLCTFGWGTPTIDARSTSFGKSPSMWDLYHPYRRKSTAEPLPLP